VSSPNLAFACADLGTCTREIEGLLAMKIDANENAVESFNTN